jgi:6-phosphogluconolactonase
MTLLLPQIMPMRCLFTACYAFLSMITIGQNPPKLLIGTYTNSGSHGIYVAHFNEATGQITLVDSAAANNPSFLCKSPSGKKVYAVSEQAGKTSGEVLSLNYEEATGKLTLINRQSSGGDHPCHVSIDAKSQYVAVSNYTGGSIGLLPLDVNGGLLPAIQVIQRFGSSANKARQEKPHVHQAVFSPKQKHLVINDLGTDEVVAYPFTAGKSVPLDTNKIKKIKLSGGAGPRHLVFHPTKSIFYVIEEMSGKVSVHAFNKRNIALLQTIESDTISVQPGSAAIHLSADGKFLYASNRADANNISIYKIIEGDGKLKHVGTQALPGRGPRDFVLHPSGKWLLVGLQYSNLLVVYRRDPQTGLLSPANQQLALPSPVCLLF